jgi:hypothetical protein
MEIKNDIDLVFGLERGLNNKIKYIVADKCVYDLETSEDVPSDIECSEIYDDGVLSGELVQDALKKMCEFMAQTGVALDDMDKEAERKNMSLGEQLK